jgi:hypothetical protein
VQNNSIFLELVAKQKKINKTHHYNFHLKTKIDSPDESGKNFITWACPASTTIIYNNAV